MTADDSIGKLLADIADALGQLHGKGVQPVLRHNAVLTNTGYVLPDVNGDSWSVRMKINDPTLVPVGDPDDD